MMDMFPEMTRFQKEMNRFFSGLTQEYDQHYPPVNVWIGEDGVLVRAELPAPVCRGGGKDPDPL